MSISNYFKLSDERATILAKTIAEGLSQVVTGKSELSELIQHALAPCETENEKLAQMIVLGMAVNDLENRHK